MVVFNLKCETGSTEGGMTEEMEGMGSLLYLLKLNSHFVDCLKPSYSGWREWQR